MTLSIWLPPLVRAVTTALLVVSASELAERAGPFWGALIASLPVSAGPAYAFLALQHDGGFVAASALSSAAANAATGVFLIVYALLAGRMSAWPTLAAAIVAWLAASLALQPMPWTAPTALLLNLAVYGAALALLRPSEKMPPPAPRALVRRWFDLPARAAAVGAFVTLVVGVSSMIGPQATGMAAVFPISITCLFVVLRPRLGAAASSRLAVELLRPMLGFGIMLLALHLAVRPLGVAGAFAIALLLTTGWSLALLLLRGRPL